MSTRWKSVPQRSAVLNLFGTRCLEGLACAQRGACRFHMPRGSTDVCLDTVAMYRARMFCQERPGNTPPWTRRQAHVQRSRISPADSSSLRQLARARRELCRETCLVRASPRYLCVNASGRPCSCDCIGESMTACTSKCCPWTCQRTRSALVPLRPFCCTYFVFLLDK